jgi:hypothetical protein
MYSNPLNLLLSYANRLVIGDQYTRCHSYSFCCNATIAHPTGIVNNYFANPHVLARLNVARTMVYQAFCGF